MSIVKTEGVCGGSARINDTRIPVWIVYQMSISGATKEHIVTAFPSLKVYEIDEALAYADEHTEEINSELEASKLYGKQFTKH